MGLLDWLLGKRSTKRVIQRLLQDRIVFLGLPIDRAVSMAVCKSLRQLAAKESKPISLFVNSPGGAVIEGLAILKAMDEVSIPVHTYCIGQSHAMAAMVVAHGARGFRYAIKKSLFELSPVFTGANANAETNAEIPQFQSICDSILSKDTGMPLAEVKDMTERPTILDAEGALRFGIIDQVISELPLKQG